MIKPFLDNHIALRYDTARALPKESIGLWTGTLKVNLPAQPKYRVLDLGSGIGRSSEALAKHFPARSWPLIHPGPCLPSLPEEKAFIRDGKGLSTFRSVL